jgi:hypothetical protein
VTKLGGSESGGGENSRLHGAAHPRLLRLFEAFARAQRSRPRAPPPGVTNGQS